MAKVLVDYPSQYVVLLGWFGDKLLYHEFAREPGFTLKAVDLQGESSVFMSLPAPGYEIEEPTPSPDGKYVVARRDEKSIVVIDVANQATQTIDNASSYSWARDG